MAAGPDDLELLLTDVRKTISDNKQFLKTLGDEQYSEQEDEEEATSDVSPASEEDFEEL
jgi:hypothetical protein